MSNLLVRIITASIGGAIVVSAIITSPYGLWLFGFVVSMIGLFEFLRGMGVKELRFILPVGIIGATVWALLLIEVPDTHSVAAMMLIVPIFEVLILFYPHEKSPQVQLGNIALGFFYCYLPLVLFYKLAVPDKMVGYDYHLPLGILLLHWTLDTGAYFAGKALGRHPLYPRISPKKTWEGAIGGTLACLAVGGVLATHMPLQVPEGPMEFPSGHWWAAAIIVSVFSQLGDLVESMFKRSVKIKDSGNILPGHGGMLDRFDGLFLSIPFLYLYFLLL